MRDPTLPPLCFEWIARLTEDDEERVNHLLQKHLSEHSPGTSIEQVNAAVEAGTSIGCLRDPAGAIQGLAVLVQARDLYGTFGIIEEVVIHPSYRRQGYSRPLLEPLLQRARERGYARIQLTSKPRREDANIVYPKLGFQLVHTNFYSLRLTST